MEPVVPLPLDSSTLESLTSSAKDWAILNGVAFLTSAHDDARDVYSFKRFALLPSPVPRFLFDQAKAVQQDFNLLIHKVSQDREFLTRCLKSVVKVDDFTAALFDIYEQVQGEGVAQPVRLGLYRSDYLLGSTNAASETSQNTVCTSGQLELKQTEINTIAVTGAGFGEKIAGLHKHGLRRLGLTDINKNIPDNSALNQNVDGLIAAWEQYGSSKAIIVFVVEDERCGRVFNQRLMEFTIMERNPSIVVKRYNLRQIEEDAELKPDKTLFIHGSEVAVVYFRAGYSPDHYPTKKEWSARLKMERSKAIKCPCISYHLAGTKKVQQEVAQPGVLERFLEDPRAVGRVRATFAGQYTLELGLEGDKTVQMATTNPQDFIMKPQREGGGNNIFGEDIRTLLNTLGDSEERSAFVVMDRIHPAVVPNYHIKAGQEPKLLQSSSELGIFGVFMAEGDRVLLNKQTGHYMRTKDSSATEEGIDNGVSVMDSPFLV
ncbi:GSS [Branchiostoma lanceolatum]|uniref:Glutathione synthetase n=1 Tax=Branchiostoma lanceolatum TaxID=7740 RepID=A0A8K0EZ36_BRALA|nr:GSS [Branchiostoma lanceolatum]